MPEQDEGYQLIGEPEMDGEEAAVPEPEPTPEPAPEPEAASDPEPPEETPEQIEAKKKLTGSARAKAKAERLAEENRLLHERLTKLEQAANPEKPKPVINDGRPQIENFETHAEWVEALADWKLEQKLAEVKAKEQSAKVLDSWEQKKESARAKYEDFDDALDSAESPSPAVAGVLVESEHGAEVAYWLASHPEDYRRINQMSPSAAALAVARIEAGFTKSEPPPPKPTTKAPPPMRPTHGGVAAPQEDSGYVIY